MTTASPPGVALDDLAFPVARARDRWYDVLDVGGRVVARYRVDTWTRRFTAVTADGQPLCTGRARRLLRRYVVRDPSGTTLLWIRTSLLSALWSARRRSVRIAGERLSLRAQGQLSPDWVLTDPHGRTAVVMTPSDKSLWALNSGPLLARAHDPRWRNLQLMVALVVGNRQESEATRIGDWG